ncbi:MAG: hypothetical protein DWQ37_08925 [Planctomycetota bacterium]|nr:MAG: hypothetical protein DWQ37_08925 [Planctomycetota bacterium]
MNRIQNLVDDALDWSAIPAPSVELPLTSTCSPSGPTHCLFTPEHYEANYAYPLIVWLHGPDDDERQVAQVMPLVSLRNYVAVGPRGTDAAESGIGYQWSQNADGVAEAERRVMAAVAAARRAFNIAPGRIYLAGYDCGGTMALRIALNQPRWFAGVLSISGAFPTTGRPLARLNELRGSEIFLATGRHSKQYPEHEVCRTLRLLHAAGMSVNLRQYPCDDEVTSDMLADMDRWIMEQVSSLQPAAASQQGHYSRRK